MADHGDDVDEKDIRELRQILSEESQNMFSEGMRLALTQYLADFEKYDSFRIAATTALNKLLYAVITLYKASGKNDKAVFMNLVDLTYEAVKQADPNGWFGNQENRRGSA